MRNGHIYRKILKPITSRFTMQLPKATLSSWAQKPSPRVHVLGLGSIGTFAAHSVTEIVNGPSVTLLLHRKSLFDAYRKNGNKILVETADGEHISSEGYGFEALQDGKWYHTSPTEASESPSSPAVDTVENLIICVKATQTVDALRPLQHRLNSNSTILFLQNGSGMVDEVNTHLFTDTKTRPRYLMGVISHGVTLNSSFNITHTGFSATSIGLIPREDEAACLQRFSPSQESNYLLQTLPSSARLNLTSYPYTSALQVQLEKLAINAFCNPLCALHDSPNGFLFTLPEIRREILTEISNVVLALPELQAVPGVTERFAVAKLEATVNAVLQKTYNSTCSMVWDLRAGRETEVKFINGSWSRMGRRVEVDTPVNDRLVAQVEERSLKARELKTV